MSQDAKTLLHFASYVPMADEAAQGHAYHAARAWAAYIIANACEGV